MRSIRWLVLGLALASCSPETKEAERGPSLHTIQRSRAGEPGVHPRTPQTEREIDAVGRSEPRR